MCDAQSFADGADGAFSEFGGQSEYDPVVPGGSVNDGMSDEGSSRWVPFVCYDKGGIYSPKSFYLAGLLN